MTIVRGIQILALILTLVAGYLWTKRLGNLVFARETVQIADRVNEQVEIIEERLEGEQRPTELLSFGKNLLESNNPRIALIPLKKVTRIAPDLRDGWYLLGYCYLQLAQSDDIASDQDRQVLLNNGAAALQRAKKIDPAHQPTLDLLNQL